MKRFMVDRLKVEVYPDREALGRAAAADVAGTMRMLLGRQERVRAIFAAAPSQNEMLASLTAEGDLEWQRVTAFHMDEYVGLPNDAPQRFGHYLREHLFDLVHPGEVHYLGQKDDTPAEIARYSDLLGGAPIDVVCLGIGENGHIAFNDPPVADFDDPARVKVVELEDACRRQQVNDGCFGALEQVPRRAITLTIPALMSGRYLFCCVPGPTKRTAVNRTLNDPISTECPATVLRRHPDCTLYLDRESYGEA